MHWEVCGEQFATRKLLGHHLRFRHGQASWPRLLAVASSCMACGLQCHSRPRLIRHLARCDGCLAWVKEHHEFDEAEFEAAEMQDAGDRRARRLKGVDPRAFLPAFRIA